MLATQTTLHALLLSPIQRICKSTLLLHIGVVLGILGARIFTIIILNPTLEVLLELAVLRACH